MPYRDTMVVCEECGKEFIFRVEQQREQAARGEEIAPPALCPSCRGITSPERAAHEARRTERRPEPARKPESKAEHKMEATVALGPGPHEGTVKWFDSEKGYGFLAHPDGTEIFFHRSGIAPGEAINFPDGAPVTFLIEQTEKGPQAVDVARMDGETDEPDE
ncbi:MAG: cold shock domain-containing protein [Anaerolineae bacterium]|nr:cold shock domain-containing protein [Anaerolineae bacterium]